MGPGPRHLCGRIERGHRVMAKDRTDDRKLFLLCRAANCRRLAEEAIDPGAEKMLLEMARSYELLIRRYTTVN